VIVIGNASVVDYLLDLLNVNHPESSNWNPILVCHEYSIRLLKFPCNIRFIFILNESEITNMSANNPVPLHAYLYWWNDFRNENGWICWEN